MNKKDLTEADIRTKFITPAILASGWDLMTQLSEEAYFTKGRVVVRGKTVARGEANKADYLLFYKPNLPIAVIEAKDNNHTRRPGRGQPDRYGNEIADREYAQPDFDKTLILDHRVRRLAERITYSQGTTACI